MSEYLNKELKKLEELKREGILTEEEFQIKKQELLNYNENQDSDTSKTNVNQSEKEQKAEKRKSLFALIAIICLGVSIFFVTASSIDLFNNGWKALLKFSDSSSEYLNFGWDNIGIGSFILTYFLLIVAGNAPIGGIVFGALGKRSTEKGGMAKLAMILSIIIIIIYVIMMITSITLLILNIVESGGFSNSNSYY